MLYLFIINLYNEKEKEGTFLELNNGLLILFYCTHWQSQFFNWGGGGELKDIIRSEIDLINIQYY